MNCCNCVCNCDYACIKKWSKIFTYSCSAAVIGLGIAKFFNVTNAMNPIDYIINVYLIFLGLVLFSCEFGWERVLLYFNFLRYFFGKSFYVIFLGLLCFDEKFWFQIFVAAFLFASAALYIVLGLSCCGSEKEFNSNRIVNKAVQNV